MLTPDTITLNALAGDNTVIIIMNENGVQTTINAGGTSAETDSPGNNGGSDPGNGGGTGEDEN